MDLDLVTNIGRYRGFTDKISGCRREKAGS